MITQLQLEHRLSALLQLHIHSWQNTWFQWIRQRQLQDGAKIISVLGLVRLIFETLQYILYDAVYWHYIRWSVEFILFQILHSLSARSKYGVSFVSSYLVLYLAIVIACNRGPLLQIWFAIISASMNNQMRSKVLNEITILSPNWTFSTLKLDNR